MDVNNRIIQPNIIRTGNANALQKAPVRHEKTQGFEEILRQKIDETSGLKFSKHAENRLRERNISLTSDQKEKLGNAVSKAGSKGVKDTLVLVDNLAFVVNVRSRTVITAVTSNELKENVFTNIDGAVIT